MDLPEKSSIVLDATWVELGVNVVLLYLRKARVPRPDSHLEGAEALEAHGVWLVGRGAEHAVPVAPGYR